MHTRRLLPLTLIFTFALAGFGQTAKRPLNHRDYDSWRSIQTPVLSPDGKFLAYALMPEEGDGQLVVRNLATGKELRESCGAAPAFGENVSEEAPAEGPPGTPRSIHIAFTHDNAFVVAGAFPSKAETDRARKERKRPDEMPRESLILVNLATLSATRVADVASFEVPANGESFVAYLRGPKAGASAPAADNDRDQGRGRGAGAATGSSRGRGKYGSDLMLRDLRSAKERSFEDVIEYDIAKDGKTLLYAVASKKEDSNGVYSVTPGNDAAPSTLLSGKGHYTKLTWDLADDHAAFLSDRDDQSSKPAKFKAYLWDRSGSPAEIISTATAGFRAGYAILDRGPMTFSRDGARLFVSCAPIDEIAELAKPPARPVTAPSDEKVMADLWSWKDDYIQPMQKVRAAQDRSRSYRAVYSIADKTFRQLSDPEMAGLTPSDDGRFAIGTDDRAYRRMVDYDGNFSDVYLVDTATGARRLALKEFHGGGGRGGAGGVQLSPDGHHALAYHDKQWWSIAVPEGTTVNLTSRLGPAFWNEDHDTPDAPPAYGAAGWTKDGKWAILYDRYDAWAVAPDGSGARKLTDGRAGDVQFRIVRTDSDADSEERGIDEAKPLLFRAENLETRETGFYSEAGLNGAQLHRLIWARKIITCWVKRKTPTC